MYKFFLSHFNEDRLIAEIVANILRRVTLNQIQPWFSSDESDAGGLRPGMIWFNAILEKIEKSKAVIAILTPNSISRPWIYFETGIGQTLPDCEIIPICIGIDKNEVYPPLGLYQCYQLNNYRSLKEFICKLLSKFKIHFDEEVFKPLLEESLTKLLQIEFTKSTTKDPVLTEVLENLKNHIDKRFLEIWEKPNVDLSNSQFLNSKLEISKKEEKDYFATFTIQFEINLPDLQSKHLIEIRFNDTFSTITSNLYFIMKEHVEPYEYLQTWVIREKKSGKYFIIREIGDLIPARVLFKPGFELEVINLEKPYDPEMSVQRIIHG